MVDGGWLDQIEIAKIIKNITTSKEEALKEIPLRVNTKTVRWMPSISKMRFEEFA